MKTIKIKLALLTFIEFAVWGAYLTSLGSYLFNVGLKSDIGIFMRCKALCPYSCPH